MLQDILGSLLAVLAFTAVLYTPGYLLAFLTDLFGFRTKHFGEQSTWAIACSLLSSPILGHLIGRAAGLNGVCWVLAGTALATLTLLLKHRPAWPRRERRIAALLACGWTVFVLLMLIDLQVGRKLYFSVVMADQSYRIAFTDAVVRTGVPPANPLYFPGSPAPMRYFYFWYVLCAAVVRIAHVSSRQAFVASSVWAGFGLLVTVTLYTRHFFCWGRRQRWVALGLLTITGADLIPALGQAILQPTLNGDTEWWSVDPVDAWPDSLLWVPHHVASVLCCLLAFLLLWRTREAVSRRDRLWAVLLAGFSFASAFGLSVYVAFGFALLVSAWLLRLLVRRDPERSSLLQRVALAGVLSAILLAPLLQELLSHPTLPAATPNVAAAAGPPGHVFSLSVRRLIDSELLTGLPALAPWNRAHPVLFDQGIRLLLLLPGLAMELGLYGAVLVLLLLARRRKPVPNPNPAHDTAVFLTVVGLILTMFLSSSVITNNDFGYRAVMLPQFFLLLLTAELLGSWHRFSEGALVPQTPTHRRLLYALLVLGAAGSVYWAFLLRAWLPLESSLPQNGYATLPADEFQIRQAFAALHRIAPPNAVVAFRPIDPTPDRRQAVMVPNEFYQRMLVMDAGRQMLNAEGKCATHFGGDAGPCRAIQTETTRLYATPAPNGDWARRYCSHFGVEYLVLSAWDPDWPGTAGWPVTLPMVVSEPRLRIFQCD